jgi:hypothetical protein
MKELEAAIRVERNGLQSHSTTELFRCDLRLVLLAPGLVLKGKKLLNGKILDPPPPRGEVSTHGFGIRKGGFLIRTLVERKVDLDGRRRPRENALPPVRSGLYLRDLK